MTYPLLRAINAQCAAVHGDKVIDRVRIHPHDRDRFTREVADYYSVPLGEGEEIVSFAGVPIIEDTAAIDGPIVDWQEVPDLAGALQTLREHMHG